jgi:hypothetical protein
MTLAVTCLLASTSAQEVSIPDPGLNSSIRDALQKPVGPLTGQDLLGLTALNAIGRIMTSTNLAEWSELGVTTNTLGKIVFADVTAHLSPWKFYRTRIIP